MLNLLGSYTRRRLVPRRWVLDFWHARLRALRPGHDVIVAEREHDFDRLTDLVDPEKSLIAKLGVLGVDITEANAGMAASLRNPSGVIVVGHTKNEADAADAGLQTADAIHGLNGKPVMSLEQLNTALDALERRSPVVLEIERNGQTVFLAFELE